MIILLQSFDMAGRCHKLLQVEGFVIRHLLDIQHQLLLLCQYTHILGLWDNILNEMGVRVESLARVASMSVEGGVVFCDD